MLSHCTCQFEPRPAQQAILDLIFGPKANEDTWYIVSPPGSGKTILGLMVAVRLNLPTVVLAPNTAIQSQWVAKTRFFIAEDAPPVASVDPDDALPITVLTYQALARTETLDDAIRAELEAEWLQELVDDGDTEANAREWLADYAERNPDRHQASLLRRWKRRRIKTGEDGMLGLVAEESQAIMRRLRDRGVRLVILDECHHLVGYWAQVALALVGVLDRPRVLGLTATPPSTGDLNDQEVALHKQLLDDVDYALPTPAVVRDGNLAPYQDLVYLTRPTTGELDYVRDCSRNLGAALAVVENHPGTTLSAWIEQEVAAVPDTQWTSALRRRALFFDEAADYLRGFGRPLPDRLRGLDPPDLGLEARADLVGRYARRCLMVSEDPAERRLFETLNRSLRPLGFLLTENGLRRCQSTVNRVLALSEAKMAALVAVLEAEIAAGAAAIRALVVCDFERSSATIAKEVDHLLTSESGGAVAAMRALTANPATDDLDPILVTGQTVIVDDDLLPVYEREAAAWFADRGLSVETRHVRDGGFYRVEGRGSGWTSRNYVMMITELFERGVTRCLVGTRGLLGEGWDALAVNTLIDLTAAATEMTVNQLRGRSIRADPANPRKVANNWDIVCLAPEFEQGLSDYHRFARKHKGYYGVCDDGAIEYGLGHIHPSLTETGPEDVALHAELLNAEMLQRCARRELIYDSWKVGEPYDNVELPTLEVKPGEAFGAFAVAGSLDAPRAYQITAAEALQRICLALYDAIVEVGGFADPKANVQGSERSDGYFRIALHSAEPKDMTLFASCLGELLAPVDDQRYIIPRYEQIREDTWISRLLPEVLRPYAQRKRNEIALYHPLPDRFGKSRKTADIFQRKWNLHVSPGEALFTKRGQGEQAVATARALSRAKLAGAPRVKTVWR